LYRVGHSLILKMSGFGRSFEKSEKKINRSFALLKRAEMSDERMSDCPTLLLY